MNRRRVLTLIGGMTVLAGCSSRDQETETTPTPTETQTPPPNETTPPPDGTALSRGLEFGHQITGAFTPNSPATLELHCTNRFETRITGTTTLGPPLPFSSRFGWNTTRDAQVLLYPDGEPDIWFQIDENGLVPVSEVLPEDVENGCWRVSSKYDGIAEPPGQVSREIVADGTLTHQYILYHMHSCVPGTYSFSQSITLTADGYKPEEYVPLLLRVVVRDDGEIDIEFFGIQEGYPS